MEFIHRRYFQVCCERRWTLSTRVENFTHMSVSYIFTKLPFTHTLSTFGQVHQPLVSLMWTGFKEIVSNWSHTIYQTPATVTLLQCCIPELVLSVLDEFFMSVLMNLLYLCPLNINTHNQYDKKQNPNLFVVEVPQMPVGFLP